MTIKTVESHLASVFRKLDISSRQDLPDELAADQAADAGVLAA